MLEALDAGSPRLRVAVSDGEVMGGDGGESFAFKGRQQAVQRRRRLVRIGLRSQARVDQIRLRYRQDSGGFDPQQDWEEVHGGERGNRLLDWTPAPGAVLLGFSGRSQAELDALRPVIARFDPPALGAGSRKRGPLKGRSDRRQRGLA